MTPGTVSIRPGLLVTIGELLVDFVPQQPGTSIGEAAVFTRAAGGAPANVAAAAARLGADSAFIGRVGADPFGYWLVQQLRACGVHTDGVTLDPTANTTLAFVSLSDDADRDFLFYRTATADTRLSPADLDKGLLSRATVLHFCSNSLTHEPARSATLEAIRLARAAGALISYDVNWRPGLWDDGQAGILQALKAARQADVLKLSESELGLLNASGGPDDAGGFLAAGAQLVLISRGAAGVEAHTKGFSTELAGLPVAAVDTTGAGDALAGAFLSALTADPGLAGNREALTSALARANAAAALSTTRPGAIPSYPDAAELGQFLSSGAAG